MSYLGASGTQRTYVSTDQPLYGLGGNGLGAMGEYELRSASGLGQYELRGLGQYELRGLRGLRGLGEDPVPGSTAPVTAAPAAPPPGFSMPAGIACVWWLPDGSPNPDGASFAQKFFGRMVDATGVAMQGVMCDNVAGPASPPGASINATTAMQSWAGAGYFVFASKKAGICDASPGAYGKAVWTAYRVPKERLGEMVGSGDPMVAMPWNEAPTAAAWAKYAPFLTRKDTVTGGGVTTGGGVSESGVSGRTLLVLAALAGAAYWLSQRPGGF